MDDQVHYGMNSKLVSLQILIQPRVTDVTLGTLVPVSERYSTDALTGGRLQPVSRISPLPPGVLDTPDSPSLFSAAFAFVGSIFAFPRRVPDLWPRGSGYMWQLLLRYSAY